MVFFTLTLDVLLFSFLIVIVINVFQRLLVKQADAKLSKDRMKELNKKMRNAQKTGSKEEADGLFKEVMREQGRLMRMSFKPMIISVIITFVSLPWIGSVYGDRAVGITDGKGTLDFAGSQFTVERNGEIITVAGKSCAMPCRLDAGGYVYNAEPQGSNVKVSPVVALLPFSAPFLGDDLGWLGWYLLSFFFMMIISRKFLKIYV